MTKSPKTRTRDQSLNWSSAISFRENLLQRLYETRKRAVALRRATLCPVADVVLEGLRDRDLVRISARSLKVFDVPLELFVADLVEIQGILDNLVTDMLVLGQDVVETVEFLGVLELMFEQLCDVGM